MTKFMFDYLFAFGIIVISDILYFNIYSARALNIQSKKKSIILAIQALLSIYYPMSGDINNSYIIVYYISLAVPLFYFKDSLKSKICNFLLAFGMYSLTEFIISTISLLILVLLGYENTFLSDIIGQYRVINYFLYIVILVIYGLLTYFFIQIFNRLKMKNVSSDILLIDLLLIIIINNVNIIAVASKDTFVLYTIIYIVLSIISVILLLFILKQIVIKNKENKKNEYRISLYNEQLNGLKMMKDNYKMVRRNYHDVNNHLIVLSQLFRRKGEDDLIKYIVEVDKKYNGADGINKC